MTSGDRYVQLETYFKYGVEHFQRYKYLSEYLYYIFKAPIEEHDYITFTVNLEGYYTSFYPYYMFSDLNLDESALAYRTDSFIQAYPVKYDEYTGDYSFEVNYEKSYANYCYLIFRIEGIDEGKYVYLDIKSEYSLSSFAVFLIILIIVGSCIFLAVISMACAKMMGRSSVEGLAFLCAICILCTRCKR